MPGLSESAAALLTLAVVLGHGMLAVVAYNRLHALPLDYRHLRWIERSTIFPFTLALPAYWLAMVATQRLPIDRWLDPIPLWYRAVCLAALGISTVEVLLRGARRRTDERPLLENHTDVHDWSSEIDPLLKGMKTRFLGRLPGNEILKPHVHRKRLAVPRLPSELEGLLIAHLSDFHLTGKFTRTFYERIVDEANGWEPDLMVLSGDLVDHRDCLDWIPDIFGRLEARLGVIFVLGNHDVRVGDTLDLRRRLTDCGLVDLGGRHLTTTWNGAPVSCVGDERPWFSVGDEVRALPKRRLESSECRILIAHSPDRFPWAVAHDFDLVLAGHTHGGQIRVPGIGPIVAPSLYGTRFASGVFQRRQTVMHVSRGLCGVHAVRFNCPPELALLSLTASGV